MKIEHYEKIGVSKYRLYLDNGEVIDTYDEVILQNNLLLKKELDHTLYQKIITESNLQEHYNACLKYISIRLRSTKEIKDYLKRKNVEAEDIELIVTKLTDNQFLNDKVFCECFIKDKLKFTNMGEYRIIAELKKHEIAPQIIEDSRELMNDDIMQEKMQKIIEKQIQTNRKLDPYKLRNKLYNHLLRDGYNSANVVRVLNSYFD